MFPTAEQLSAGFGKGRAAHRLGGKEEGTTGWGSVGFGTVSEAKPQARMQIGNGAWALVLNIF